ncbi:synaptotagmin-like protein 2 [Bombina bombina]|uniref:synaptotagmin-like protein 2 n=1 Tax=Bombina bombina TaxID=8345 RepID=UPI00235B2598|nr:synaptotagmin-like protein 2 [Bombina bombina]XP_053555107.1 synaptotagmin-like protein 2 [Bombina bombina]XP_053555108.1 synaptotagmin-like protein 2 [Bombina bombina]XP_053555109.1 synaptotagmin-like protein 2 [Bombina bombina]
MKNSAGTMLDLSFLTEEEYNKLMKVLQRDEELQKKDGDRIRRLQGSIKDEKKKKFVTGEWFYDVKSQRFQEDLHGSDLLRASIRKKKVQTQHLSNGGACDNKQAIRGIPAFAECQVNQRTERVNDDKEYEEILSDASIQKDIPPFLPETSPQCAFEKRSSISDVSSVDTGIGLTPSQDSLTSKSSGQVGQTILPDTPTNLSASGDNRDQNFTQENTSVKSPSKIPVKRKSSIGLSWPETGLQLDQSDNNAKKSEAPGRSGLSSPEAEFDKDLRSGSNFTVQSMKDKLTEQDAMLDKDQFMSLKKFWEKGADNSASMKGTYNQDVVETKHPQEPSTRQQPVLNCASSIQSNKSQNGEVSPELPYRLRHVSHRAPVLSSSEDEQFYVAPPRKGSSSMIPRSTYGKSKGSSISKSVSVSENNGTTSHSEESSGTSRASRKSKLPIRAPSVHQEKKVDSPSSPQDEKFETVPESEMLGFVEEHIIPESKPQVSESLFSRVQILIDTVTSDEEQCKKIIEHTDRKGGDMTENTATETENDLGASENSETINTSQITSLSNARSMVNIYTTTETYNKPQAVTHQLLEPERAKELSRSTPALLSETESDTASEISFQLRRHRKTQSSGSNSSDMASVSSVSNSVLSVYSGDFGSVDAQGTVQFSLDYDEKNREFQIFVAQCKDLAVVDEKKGRSDPYVKTYLLPDKARMGKRKTSVKRRTTNPVYNEVLRYKIDKMVLLIQKLNLSVWHNDPLGRNSFLGEMEIDLTSWDWSNVKPNWYTLKPRSLSAMNGVDHRGVMNLSIKYIPPGSLGPKHPSSGEVHIWVKDTKDLPQLRPSGVDSFVKCYVLPDTSKKSYQKTRVIKRDSNPVFNHTIVYDGFHTEDLKDACVELTVWDHEKLSNHFLGGIRLGLGTGCSYGISVDWMDSTQEEVAFWQEMISTPNEWIEGSLPLRSLAGRRKFK